MAEVIRNTKPAAERPLKTSPATGACLATLGIQNSIPLLHGAQGCGAFTKVYLIQHFREPMPIQNTAVDQLAAVMGSDDNIQLALATLCESTEAECITLISTGLTELQGTDLERNLSLFRINYPMFADKLLVSVACPDFVGSLQTGFSAAVNAIVKQALKKQTVREINPKQITLLCSSVLTSADIELIKTYLIAFKLDAIVVPDLSLSLDGHLNESNYNTTSTGGSSVASLKKIANSCATIVVGESMFKTGQWLEKTFNTPCYSFAHLMGLTATDSLITALAEISGLNTPPIFIRLRQRLQDILLDTHFVNSTARIAVAMETDALLGFDALLHEVGAHLVRAVSATNTPSLLKLNADTVVVGDHSDLDDVIDTVDVLIGNTHCAEFFEPDTPVMRSGFPCHDRYGNSDQLNVGYQGARARLNELANTLLMHCHTSVPAYVSPYRFSRDEMKKADAS